MKSYIYILIPLLYFTMVTFESDAKSTSTNKKKYQINTTTVKNIDLERYMGKWYEIARFDTWFEHDMDYVTATYLLNDNGKIEVINCGYKTQKGKNSCSHGRAKVANNKNDGKLKVSFFLWFWADYYILELDKENYMYALIGSSKDKYLWILSRTPTLDKKILDMLINRANERGYDTSKLVFPKQ